MLISLKAKDSVSNSACIRFTSESSVEIGWNVLFSSRLKKRYPSLVMWMDIVLSSDAFEYSKKK